jgi:predicted DNA-binding transcriptional regulator AlpA
MNKRFLTTKEAAEYTGWSEPFLRQARSDGNRKNRTPGPPYIKGVRKVMYDINDLDEWLLQYRKTG